MTVALRKKIIDFGFLATTALVLACLVGCGTPPKIMGTSAKRGAQPSTPALNADVRTTTNGGQTSFQVKSLPLLKSSIEACVGGGVERLRLKAQMIVPDNGRVAITVASSGMAAAEASATNMKFLVSEKYKQVACVNELLRAGDASMRPQKDLVTALNGVLSANTACDTPSIRGTMCGVLVNMHAKRLGKSTLNDPAVGTFQAAITGENPAATANTGAAPCFSVRDRDEFSLFAPTGPVRPQKAALEFKELNVLDLEGETLNDPSRASRMSVNSDILTDGFLRSLSIISDVVAFNCAPGSMCDCSTPEAALDMFKRCLPAIAPDGAASAIDEFQKMCSTGEIGRRRAIASLIRSYAFAAAR